MDKLLIPFALPFIIPGPIFGTGIVAINFYNRKKSPIYHETDGSIITMQIGAMSVLKGCIYGTFWPIAGCGILLHTCNGRNPKQFESHFVPFSKYR